MSAPARFDNFEARPFVLEKQWINCRARRQNKQADKYHSQRLSCTAAQMTHSRGGGVSQTRTTQAGY